MDHWLAPAPSTVTSVLNLDPWVSGVYKIFITSAHAQCIVLLPRGGAHELGGGDGDKETIQEGRLGVHEWLMAYKRRGVARRCMGGLVVRTPFIVHHSLRFRPATENGKDPTGTDAGVGCSTRLARRCLPLPISILL